MEHPSHHLLRRIRFCASSPLIFAGKLLPSWSVFTPECAAECSLHSEGGCSGCAWARVSQAVQHKLFIQNTSKIVSCAHDSEPDSTTFMSSSKLMQCTLFQPVTHVYSGKRDIVSCYRSVKYTEGHRVQSLELLLRSGPSLVWSEKATCTAGSS